ncbi:MAG: hypothetical protein FJX66_09725 [Alphaproteobacteria bacterium]|nr:hypothetical protein [Alphaproteobacteria bacterium]
MAGVYENVDELCEAVAKETGVGAKDVRKVLRASFASTSAFIERQISGQLSEGELNQAAGGLNPQPLPPGASPAQVIKTLNVRGAKIRMGGDIPGV